MMLMKMSPAQFFKVCSIIFFINLIFLSGCQTNESANSNKPKQPKASSEKKSVPSDNLDELLNLIKLPIVPDELVWLEEDELGKKKLTAVLQYNPENDPKILAILEKYKQPEQVEVGVENWFPEELTAQAQLSGVEMLKGTAYGANEFFNIPYGSGRITRIEGTTYFVLELQAN